MILRSANGVIMAWQGEKEAWDVLSRCHSKDIKTKAIALFNPRDSTYGLTCFGQDICISLRDRSVISKSGPGNALVNELGDYSRLSILRYLIHAIDLSRLVNRSARFHHFFPHSPN